MPRGNNIPRVPADRARNHVELLIGEFNGVTGPHIASLAGVSRTTVHRLRTGADRITAEAEDRILAVTPRHLRLVPPRHVPKDRAVAHIRRLLEHPDVNRFMIGRASGLSHQAIYQIITDETTCCEFRTHVKIMAVTVDSALQQAAFAPVGPTVTRRNALRANGWNCVAQQAMCGIDVQAIRGTHIEVATEVAVRAMYDRLGDTRGPDDRCIRAAVAEGCRTPINYDDDMRLIDVEDTDDDGQDFARTCLIIAGMSIAGTFPVEIGLRVGLNRDYVATLRARSGLRTIPGADTSRVVFKPGMEPLIERIRGLVDGIEVRERTDVLDTPGIDYVARWDILAAAAEKTRKEVTTAA